MPWRIHIHPHSQSFDQRLLSVKDRELNLAHLLTNVKRCYGGRHKISWHSPNDCVTYATQSSKRSFAISLAMHIRLLRLNHTVARTQVLRFMSIGSSIYGHRFGDLPKAELRFPSTLLIYYTFPLLSYWITIHNPNSITDSLDTPIILYILPTNPHFHPLESRRSLTR